MKSALKNADLGTTVELTAPMTAALPPPERPGNVGRSEAGSLLLVLVGGFKQATLTDIAPARAAVEYLWMG